MNRISINEKNISVSSLSYLFKVKPVEDSSRINGQTDVPTGIACFTYTCILSGMWVLWLIHITVNCYPPTVIRTSVIQWIRHCISHPQVSHTSAFHFLIQQKELFHMWIRLRVACEKAVGGLRNAGSFYHLFIHGFLFHYFTPIWSHTVVVMQKQASRTNHLTNSPPSYYDQPV